MEYLRIALENFQIIPADEQEEVGSPMLVPSSSVRETDTELELEEKMKVIVNSLLQRDVIESCIKALQRSANTNK
jgi:hypothetical protein